MGKNEQICPTDQFYTDTRGWLLGLFSEPGYSSRFGDVTPSLVLSHAYKKMSETDQQKTRRSVVDLLHELTDKPDRKTFSPEAADELVLSSGFLFKETDERQEVINLLKSIIENSGARNISVTLDTDRTITLRERAAQALIGLKALEPVDYWRNLGEEGGFFVHVAFRGMVLADFDTGFKWIVSKIPDHDAFLALINSLPLLLEIYGESCTPYIIEAERKLKGTELRDLRFIKQRSSLLHK